LAVGATARPAITAAASEPAAVFNAVERASRWRTADGTFDARYLPLFGASGGADAELRALFDRYRALRGRYRGSDGGIVAALQGQGYPHPVRTARFRAEDKVAVLFLGAETWEDVTARAELVTSLADAAPP